MFEPSIKRPQTASLAAIGLLAVYFLLGASAAARQSITYDEPAHWRYGLQVLHGDTRRFDDSKMPATALNATPLLAAQKFRPEIPMSGLLVLWLSRLPTLAAACLLGWLVFAWARTLFGAAAGLAACAFFILDPNIQAHARFITTDVYAALGITASLYLFWKYTQRPGWVRAVSAGAVLGLAQLAKFTCVYLYLLLPVIAIVNAAANMPNIKKTLPAFIAHLLLIVLVSLMVLGAGYLWNGWGTPLGGYTFKSELFHFLQDHAGFLNRVPLPLPRPFVEGLDWVRFYEQSTAGRGPSYLWGQTLHGAFPNYYAWVVLYKIPIGAQLLFLWAVVRWAMRRPTWRQFSHREIFLVLPMIFFAVYFNYLCKAQMGVRMILAVFPLLYVLAGSLLADRLADPQRRTRIGWIAGLGAWAAVSVFSQYPHALSYFNELAGRTGGHYRILADSNLEWGQSGFFIKKYLRQHPGTQLDPVSPRPGRIAISANYLAGIVRPEKYTWARWVSKNLTPVDVIANGSYLVYDLSQEDIQKSNAAAGR